MSASANTNTNASANVIQHRDQIPAGDLLTKDYLQTFLNLYWLRPETALLCSLLAKKVATKLAKENVLASLSENLDLSCGDGLFAFTLLGGELQKEFNLYASSKVESSVVDKKDIYDSFDPGYQPRVMRSPVTSMRAGLDINQNMLARAERIGIYRKLIQARAEDYRTAVHNPEDEASGEKDGYYASASMFSSIYMYANTGQLLQSVSSVLAPGGHFIVNVKTPLFRQFYEQVEAVYPATFAKYIERNMRGILTNLQDVRAWEQHFASAGFSVVARENTMNAAMVPVWTIGLRSLTPLLIKIVDKVPTASLMEVKSEFVETFHSVLAELYACGDEVQSGEEAASLVYVLEKKV